MKYCPYCGYKVNKDEKECPNCYEDISDESNEKLYHASVECIKCGSKNVDYKIAKINKHKIVFEEQIYTCKECGKQFKDKNRLGYSFNNNPQIILSVTQKKIIKWLFIILIAAIISFTIIHNKKVKEDNWVRMDCTGLKKMSLKKIKEDAPTGNDKYKGNSYIFTTTIEKINNNEIITPIEKGDYSGSYIKFNKEEVYKLERYKRGDTITFCGTVKKISMYHKVYVENATIIK